MNLKRYNSLQLAELNRVHDEIKWYLGEKLGRDPCLSPEDRKLVEDKFVEIILNGFGKYLANLNEKIEQKETTSMEKTRTFLG